MLTSFVFRILTLKLVGLAFEVNAAYTKTQGDEKAKKDDDSQTIAEPLSENEKALLKLDLQNVFHYCFNYVGILTGPYFTYKTYRDALYLPFSSKADCIGATVEKLKVIPLYAGLFLLISYVWPLNVSYLWWNYINL